MPSTADPAQALRDAMRAIRSIDYTVIFARDLPAMRRFYGETLGFALQRELSPRWIEYRIGSNVLALTVHGNGLVDDAPPPPGALSLQLAFRVAPGEVSVCAQALQAAGVALLREPTDHAFGHRTVFFRDPDGNLLEIYAEI